MSQEGEYPVWRCVTKGDIHYGAVSQEGEYPVGRCVTRRRVSIMALCH